MRFNISKQTSGSALLIVLLVTCLWLALEGKLTLYIHPRYVWFTIILCGLALFGVLAAAAYSRTPTETAHDHSHGDETHSSIASKLTLCFCLLFCLALIVVKPASLTSSAVDQRGINSASLDISSTKIDLANPDTDYSRFSLKEWASLLASATEARQFADKAVQASGFVSPSPDNNPNIFYVSRFVVTCCAIDARPVGIPVYQQNWADELDTDEWVEVRGSFIDNQGKKPAIVMQPTLLKVIEEPKDPYVY